MGARESALQMQSGRRSEVFGPPPANTELGYQACISWVAWVGIGDLATLPVATPTKGPSTPSVFRNYADPQHFCHYRGYDSAWVPGSVLGARLGRSILLFRIDLGLTGLPWFLCTTRPQAQQGLIAKQYVIAPLTCLLAA